jgi:TolB protein
LKIYHNKLQIKLSWLLTVMLMVCFSELNYGQEEEGKELEVWQIPNIEEGAEFYFSPDGQSMVGNAKLGDDSVYHVYTFKIDGTEILKINGKGEDACSFYFPDGKGLLYTSTRDNTGMPKGSFSDPNNYPQGAEIYSCDLNGENVKRLTENEYYDAEIAASPDGKWLLFTRQIDGKLDLWKMRPDGTEQHQITFTPEWQEGGAFFLDTSTIICRAWDIKDQGQRGMPMSIFTLKSDGSDIKRITHDSGTNWAPFPAPDGEHFVFIRVLPPHNYEIYPLTQAVMQKRGRENSDLI